MTEPDPRSYSLRGRVVRQGETPASSGNLANIITVVRILLAPVFVVLLVLDGGEDGWLRLAAAAQSQQRWCWMMRFLSDCCLIGVEYAYVIT